MLRKNIRLFKLWGIPVELNLSWILIFLLITWTYATMYYPANFPGLFTGSQAWVLGMLTALLLFVSILLHEFSHSIVASRNGLPIRRITLFLFGGVAQMEKDVEDPILELKMAAAGPLMSLVLAVVFYILAMAFGRVLFFSVLLRALSNINVAVLVFNMVPGFPLDGGRILRAFLWYRTKNVRWATRIASRIGTAFATVLMILGFVSFIFTGNIIYGLWLVFIGFFLRQAAQSGYLVVAFREALGHLRVGDVMRSDVVTVDAGTDLQTLVDDYFLKYHYGSFPVLDSGRLAGMVSLKDVKKVERERWPEAVVLDVLDRESQTPVLHPMDHADRLLHMIMRKGHGRLPVVDEHGIVVGIVSRRDLMEVIRMMTSLED